MIVVPRSCLHQMETLDPNFLPRAGDYMSIEVAWKVNTSVDLFTDVVKGPD